MPRSSSKTRAKATTVILFTLALVLGFGSAALAAPWNDLDNATLDAYDVSLDQISHISSGFPDGTWQPWRYITRAQLAKMAVTASAIDPANPTGQTFSDVPPSDYYYQYVEAACAAYLMRGVDEGLFDPLAPVTREQAIAVVARKVAVDQAFQLENMTEQDIASALGGFDDAAAISTGLRSELAFAVSRGLTKGNAEGNLAPKAPVSRIAAAALLIRATQPRTLQLTIEDDGATISLAVGDVIQVALKGNPTTGYVWTAALREEDTGILEQIGEPIFVPDSQLVGAGGTFTFTFKAVAAGNALPKLVYSRPWESVPPLETFAVTVKVASLPLDGTAWKLQAWSVSSLHPGDFEITAAFKDGRISGRAAVNLYSGPYSAGSGGSFSVGALSHTEMAGPEPAMQAESAFFGLLGQARSYRLSDSRLTLFDGQGNELLVFAPRVDETSFSLHLVPDALKGDSIPGQRCVFLATVTDTERENAEESVTLSATVSGADLAITPEQILEGQVAEVWVTPAEESVGRTLEVTVRGSRGETTVEQSVNFAVAEGKDDRAAYAMALRDQFVAWLDTHRPELEIAGHTEWSGSIVSPVWLIVGHYLFFSTEWEMHVSWHVMIPPHDWAKIDLRRRFSETIPSHAFEISSVSGSAEPQEIEPPGEIWR